MLLAVDQFNVAVRYRRALVDQGGSIHQGPVAVRCAPSSWSLVLARLLGSLVASRYVKAE